jgi:predicted MFS family arabinose efflux permease
MKGFRWIAGDGFLALSLIACSIANMGFQVVILLLVVEAERQNINGSFIGGLLAISGLAGFAGAVTAPRVVRRWHPRRTIKWCVVSWFPFLVVVAASGNPFIGLPAWGLCSFAGAYINVALAVYQSKNVPEDMLGRVEGVVQFLTTGAVALGASAGGYLIDTFGTRSTARLVVALFLLPLIATLFATSSRRFCAVAGVRRRAARGRPTVANHDVVAAPRAVRSPDPTLGAGVSRRR